MACFKWGRALGVSFYCQQLRLSQRNLSKSVPTFNRMHVNRRAKDERSDRNVLGLKGSPNRLIEVPLEGDEFRVLIIPGHTKMKSDKETVERPERSKIPSRYLTMKPEQDWTKVWPSASTFKWSVVPLPVRQGLPMAKETKGMPNAKYGNTELVKIPNFLHLTPPHIKKHCKALKEFCTPWPENLETDEEIEKHFPVNIVTREYVRDAPTHRDSRGRMVTLKIKLSSLQLDHHARNKLLRLVGDRYDPDTDVLTLTADRCPLKKQNYDYTFYLLTALYHESWKTEPWESERHLADMDTYIWDDTPARKRVVDTVQNIINCKIEAATVSSDYAEGLPRPGALEACGEAEEGESGEVSEELIVKTESVDQVRQATETLHNEGENVVNLEQYRQAVTRLLLGSAS